MANWANGEPPKSAQRRKWNLEDKSSLKNLKYQVAENGCSHSQYDLARLLLLLEVNGSSNESAANNDRVNDNAANALDEAEQSANFAQGIYWLLRAADQGHADAVRLLADCYATRRGINERNEFEVQTFLAQSTAERSARRAARELFACLSNGEHYITAAQLERKMRQIWNIQIDRQTGRRRRRRNGSYGSDDQQHYSSDDSDYGDDDDEVDDGDVDDDDHIDLDADRAEGLAGRLSRSPGRRRGHNHRRYNHRQQRHNLNAGTMDDDLNGGCITEAHLVSAAVNYSHGHLPTVNRALQLSRPAAHSLDHIPCFHRLLFHPLTFLLLCYHRFVNTFAKLSDTAAANLRLVAVLLLYTFLSSDNLASFAPLAVHYLSLAVMFASTVRILKARQEFVDFRMWSGLFLSYGDRGVDAPASENLFLRRRMQPYLWFFGAFCCNVMVTPLLLSGTAVSVTAASAEDPHDLHHHHHHHQQQQQHDSWMAHSEITVLAFILVFVTMLAPAGETRPGPDWLLLVSFAVNVLAKYPYEMDDVVTSGWRFVDLKAPNFPSFVLGNGIEFCLSCRALLYLLIPGVLVLLARRRLWHGTYQYVIPHCVTLAWLQICIISAQSATWFGLVRAALGLAALMLFLPLFGIVTLMIPVFAVVDWLSLTDPGVRLATFVAMAVCAVTASCCVAANRRTERYVTFIQLFVALIVTIFLALPYWTANFDAGIVGGGVKHEQQGAKQQTTFQQQQSASSSSATGVGVDLSWSQFYAYCQQPAWQQTNRISVQLRCSELDGIAIRWEGDIESVEIAGERNARADFVHAWLPTVWADWVACTFGERNRKHCRRHNGDGVGGAATASKTARAAAEETTTACNDDDDGFDGIGELLHEQQKHCNLNGWATFEYEIVVQMPVPGALLRRQQPAHIVLRASHVFGNFTQQLNVSDRVWFRGVLRNSASGGVSSSSGDWAMTLGKQRPHIELQAIGCVSCPNAPGLQAVESPIGGRGGVGGRSGELRVNGRVRDLYRGLKYLLNVLFNPLVTFK